MLQTFLKKEKSRMRAQTKVRLFLYSMQTSRITLKAKTRNIDILSHYTFITFRTKWTCAESVWQQIPKFFEMTHAMHILSCCFISAFISLHLKKSSPFQLLH